MFDHAGWAVEAAEGPMLPSGEVDALAESLGCAATDKLPDVIYGNNHLEITSGAASISVRAVDFVKGMTLDPRQDVELFPTTRLTTKDNYEFLGDFKGLVTPVVPLTERWRARAQETSKQQSIQFNKIEPRVDWTLTSLYLPTVNGCEIATEDEDPSIPYSVLADMSQPILHYRSVPLIYDDLGDSGVSEVTARIRVMPTCWFLLVRQSVRVDHVLIRKVDHRFFHQFESDCVLQESTIAEAPWRVLEEKTPLTHETLAQGGAELLGNDYIKVCVRRKHLLPA